MQTKLTHINSKADHPGFVLGVDGGGTKTMTAIADLNGELRGFGQGGPSNHDDLGAEIVGENIAAAIQQARKMAGMGDLPFASAFLGMAGVVTEKDRSAIRQIMLNLKVVDIDHIEIDHDCRIALAGGLSGRPGIVLITGTGSSCFGINATGDTWISGGWGHLISDEGSGYWLGLQALRITAGVDDGQIPHSLLYEQVRSHLNLSDTRELMYRLYVQGLSRAEIAAMAPLVIKSARHGDSAALRLLEQAADDLADCVFAAAHQLNLSSGVCEIVQTGGLLNAGDIYLQPLRSAILHKIPEACFSLPELSPVLGACLLAMQNLGITIDEHINQSLQKAQENLK